MMGATNEIELLSRFEEALSKVVEDGEIEQLPLSVAYEDATELVALRDGRLCARIPIVNSVWSSVIEWLSPVFKDVLKGYHCSYDNIVCSKVGARKDCYSHLLFNFPPQISIGRLSAPCKDQISLTKVIFSARERVGSYLIIWGRSGTVCCEQLVAVAKKNNICVGTLKGEMCCFAEGADEHFEKLVSEYAINNHVSPNSFSEFFRSLLDIAESAKREKAESFALLFIPSSSDSETRTGCCVQIWNCHKIKSVEFLDAYYRMQKEIRLWGAPMEKYLYAKECSRALAVSNTQSAIGAIMSRNGSHNIGSHVLAALSQNVGTLPDDRVLYQYIQHRMAFIATATTGFPDWGAPTMFVGEIMRNFMMQHHLLDHIVESEGLHAYHFQGHNASSEQNEKDTLRIRIEVDVPNEGILPFIPYSGKEKDLVSKVSLHDVRVAIPGGVAGHHAFYTILENVIRNSAKHGWAKSNHSQQKDLEITVRFHDDAERKHVVFTVFDNTPQGEGLIDLVKDQNKKLDAMLSGDGGLRQEDWGLAEMRISASFLQQRTLGETGGIEKLAEDGDYIIRAVPVENNGSRYLGYEFQVAKPRELLFAIPYSEEWKEIREGFSSQPDLVRKLGCAGVHVVFQYDAGADDYREFVTNQQSKEYERVLEWEYEYVILPKQPGKVRTGIYPFRMLVLSESKDGDFVWDKTRSFENEPIGDKKIPSLHDLQKRLCELFGKVVRREDEDSNVCAIKKLIRLRWLLYFEKRTRPVALLEDGKLVDCGARDIRMLIDTDGQSSGQSGQGLISDYDVCAYIFEHVFSSLLDEIGESMASAKRLKEILKEIPSERKITPLSCFESVVNAGADGQTMRLERRKEVFGDAIDLMLDKLDKVKDQKKFEPDENLRNVLVDHLVGAFPTAHALLRKYAEKIDTLPENFCENTFSSGGKREDRSYSDDDGDFEGMLTLRRRAVGDKFPPELGPKFTITYCRHGDIADRDFYRSGLSGSQAGFSQFQHMEYASGEDYSPDRQLADFSHLVEDALSRVLVIDERVCKFLTSRRRIARKLSWMNVWAVDTDMGKKFEKEQGSMVVDGGAHDMESCLRLDWDKFKECSQGKKVKDKKAFSSIFPCGKYDVLIIHQGIIDKLLGDQCTSENVAIFLTALKEQIPYVVITTGRGRPANTPRTARILPFPCVERYLFQEWPEKFLLINTIMNLLPCGGIKGVE